MHRSVTHRGSSFVLAVALSLATFGAVAPSAAAAPYSAPLTTAVRQLVVAPENTSPYDREAQFGGDWTDADGDCQNTRHEVLIAESTAAPTLSASGCTVTAGRWTPSYDGGTYTLASQLEIDHLVPVSEAWDSGAQGWTQQQRVAFYNDLGYAGSLVAISSALNQSKSDRGPEQWLPPTGVCGYITAWTAVKIRWALTVDPAEQAALLQQANACPGSTVDVETVGTPTPPATPPPATTSPTQIRVSSSTIDYGAVVALTVLGQNGAVVDLYASSAGAPARVIRTATLAGGGATWQLTPGETTRFSAQVRGGAPTVTIPVHVRRTVTIGIRQASGLYTFTGVVNRPVAGLQVTLARLDAVTKRVTGVASTRTVAGGRYELRTRLPVGQAGFYALTAPTADLQPGRSRLYGLLVPRPAPRPVVVQPVLQPPRQPIVAPAPPPRPADRDCGDFRTQREAQAFHDRYFPYYGDVARLDQGGRPGVACESLP